MPDGDIPRFLIVVSFYYREIADQLVSGATAKFREHGGLFDIVSVPGALEIPAAIAFADAAGNSGGKRYDGYVALGCVIRGETSHYDIVAGESARALMDLAINRNLAIGNGILTVENFPQAWVRARQRNKGGDAAEAAASMYATKRQMSPATSLLSPS